MVFVREIILLPALSVLLMFSPGIAGSALAQNRTDTIITPPKPAVPIHSARKATILAAVLPGSGQAYNRKYWKIPIVYAGLTAAAYFLYSNQKNYKESKANYLALTDGVDSTVSHSTKTAGELKADIDTYRRYRDMSILILLAWHGLSIIDANVDAHFFNWDVSEDLSLKIRPCPLWIPGGKPGIGLSFTFNNK